MHLYASIVNRMQANLVSHKINYLSMKPKTFIQAKPYTEWHEAMTYEINALFLNKTWTLVPQPPDKNIVSNKWFYQIKRKPNGIVDHLKARLVAKDYTQ